MTTSNDIVNSALRRLGASRVRDWAADNNREAALARDLYHETRRTLLSSHNWSFATLRVKLAKLSTVPAFGWDNAFPLPDDFLTAVSVHPSDSDFAEVPYKLEFINHTSTSGTITVVTYTSMTTDTIRLQGNNLADTTLTEGTDFTLLTSNTVTAAAIAVAISTITGLTATSSGAVVTVASDTGYTLEFITLSDAVAATRTNPTIKRQRALFTNSDTIYLRYVFDQNDPNIMTSLFRDVFSLKLARDMAIPLTQDRLLAENINAVYEKELSRAKTKDGQEDWAESMPQGSWADARTGGKGLITNDG